MKVPFDLIEGMQAARALVNSTIKKKQPKTRADVRKTIDEIFDEVLSLDRSFTLENAILDDAGDALHAQLQKKVLELLPSATKEISLERAVMTLSNLKEEAEYAFYPAAGHHSLDFVIETLANMQENVAPNANFGNGSDFYANVLSRLQFFARVKPDGAGAHLAGMAAMKCMWDGMTKKFDGGDIAAIGFPDLEVFQR